MAVKWPGPVVLTHARPLPAGRINNASMDHANAQAPVLDVRPVPIVTTTNGVQRTIATAGIAIIRLTCRAEAVIPVLNRPQDMPTGVFWTVLRALSVPIAMIIYGAHRTIAPMASAKIRQMRNVQGTHALNRLQGKPDVLLTADDRWFVLQA